MNKKVEEASEEFLNSVRAICHYWINESKVPTPKEKCEGVAFSILNLIDESYVIKPMSNIVKDFGGSLHEKF